MDLFSLRFNTYYRLTLFEYSILFLVLFFSFYFGMSTYALDNVNEGLYAEIPREMLRLGNYVIPNLNFVPYIEKPPLLFWLIALSYKLFGISAWSARLVPATFASLVSLSCVCFGNLIRHNREGWLAALILATSLGFITLARVLLFDIVLTFFFTASLLSFYVWFRSNSGFFLKAFYLFLALAFLTKGILALILIPTIVLFFLLTQPRGMQKLRRLFDPLAILIFLAIVAPWHYLAIKHQAGFGWDYFINEQLFRYFEKRIPHDYHTGPLYFYIPKIFLYLFPWSLLGIFLWKPVKQNDEALHRFLWLWFVITFIFFSLSRAKSNYYMILGVPPLALLLGMKMNPIFVRRTHSLLHFFLFFGVFESLGFGLLYAATVGFKYTNYLPKIFILERFLISPLSYMFVITLSLTCVGGVANHCYRKKPLLHFVGIIALIIPLCIFYVLDKRLIEYRHSEVTLANYINSHDASRPLYLYQDYEKISTLAFYLQKRLPIIDSQSQDLYYGMHNSKADDWFLSLKTFLITRGKETNYVVVKKDKVQDFLRNVIPHEYCIMSQSGTSVLLSNQQEDCAKRHLNKGALPVFSTPTSSQTNSSE